MFRRAIDTQTKYSGMVDLPPEKKIEVAEVDEVSETHPPKETVRPEPYLPDPALTEAVNIAIALGRPLLLQGDPGCGKTCLAYAVAYELGLPLEVCYIKSTSRAQDLLYTYDAVRRLYEAQLGGKKSPVRDVRNYIRLGPLGRAIARTQHEHGRRSVVLIDEIDKADLDFPNDLLWEIERLEFKVEEAPDMAYKLDHEKHPELRPILIVTHNEEKALPTAFLRRCVFHYIRFPESRMQLEEILSLHDLRNKELNQKGIQMLKKVRDEIAVDKKPGLSELIDWISYLDKVRHAAPADLDDLPCRETLIKQFGDMQQVEKEFSRDER